MSEKIPKRKSVFEAMGGTRDGSVQQFEIPIINVVKIIGTIAIALFLWVIKEVLGILFVSWVFASALDPWVDRLKRYHIPRGLSIFGMYVILIALVSTVIALLVDPMVQQITQIVSTLSTYAPQINSFFANAQGASGSVVSDIQRNLLDVGATLQGLQTGFFKGVSGFFGGLASVIIVLVITFYMTIEEDAVKKFVRSMAPIQYQPYLVQKTNKIQAKLGSWFRGQLIAMLIIGVLTFIGLTLLQVPYALVLAVFAGFAEFIPFLGPIISAVPAVFFAWTDSPWKALGVVIVALIIQQIENQIVTPKVMQKAVGLNPIAVIAVMLIGAQVAGIVGIILAVPAATIVWIFLEDLFEQKKAADNKLEYPTGVLEQTEEEVPAPKRKKKN